jgi:ABC-type glycerol-3-phosphate transport system substrate-binding protein
VTNSNENGSGNRSVNRRSFLKATGVGGTSIVLAGCVGGGGGGGNGSGGNGSGGGSTGDTGKPTLEIWLSFITEGETKKQWADTIIQNFQDETGIGINVTGIPYAESVNKFRAAQSAGNVPHLVEVMTNPGVLASGSMVINDGLWQSTELSDKVSDKVLAAHKTWGAQATGETGNMVSMPIGFRPYLTSWRTDWLKQAGIDPSEVNHEAGSLNWKEDVVPIMRKLKQTDLGQRSQSYPSMTGMKQTDQEYKSMYIPQFGGSMSGVVNKKGTKATIDEPQSIEAIKFYWNQVRNGNFHPNSVNAGDEESSTLHWSGQIAENHIQDSTDLWASYRTEHLKQVNNGLYTWGLPYHQNKKAAFAFTPGMGFFEAAFSGQKEKDAAARFLDFWIADPQNAVKNAQNLGFVPVNPSVIDSEPFFGKTEQHKKFWRGAAKKTLNNIQAATICALPGANAITYEIPRRMDAEIQSGTPIKQAASNAASEIETTLQESG